MARSAFSYRKARRNDFRDQRKTRHLGLGGNPLGVGAWRGCEFWVKANNDANIAERAADAVQIRMVVAQVHAKFQLKLIHVPLGKAVAQALIAFYHSKLCKQPHKRTLSRILRQLAREAA